MNSFCQQYFTRLLFLVSFCLLSPLLASASPNAESEGNKADSLRGRQKTEEAAYLTSKPESGLPDVPSLTPSDGEAQFSVAKTLGSVLFVLTLILVLAFCLRCYVPHRFGSGGKRRFIQILENVSLGEKRSLTLIRIDQENLLLATTSTSISLIKEIALRPPVESVEDEHILNRSKRPSAETVDPTVEGEEAPGSQPDHETFRNLLTSQLNESRTTNREGLHPTLSRLSQIRKELRTRLGNS